MRKYGRPRPFDLEGWRELFDKINYAAYLIHVNERILVERLREFDERKGYVRTGCNSLKGFCVKSLKFSQTQSQRIVTQVRRPPDNRPIPQCLRAHEYRFWDKPSDDENYRAVPTFNFWREHNE